jgi:lipopolysaccharide export LptBFGC system permease protein LptF
LANPSAHLRKLHHNINKQCVELDTEIRLELHSRLAFGISCVVLVLLGSALGIIFRSGHLLTSFGVSFIPASLCLITIFTGKHIAEQSPDNILGGMIFLWSGVLAVAIADIFIYKILLKR